MPPWCSRSMAAVIASVCAISLSLHTYTVASRGTGSHFASDEIRLLRDDIAALRQTMPEANGGSSNEIKLLRGDIAALRKTVAKSGGATQVNSPAQVVLPPETPLIKRGTEIVVAPTSEGKVVGGWTTEQARNVDGPKTNTSTSRRESLGFFDYSDAEWMLKKRIAKEQDQRQVAKGDNMYHDGRTFYQNNWEPNWSCGYEQRIGKTGDGGKWVCDVFRITNKPAGEECIILSVGSENDFSFEAEVHKVAPRCIIHTFDHTIDPKNIPPYVHFHPWGLGRANTQSIRTFPSILKELGLWKKQIDILKIDCEGCEFTVIDQLFWREGFFRQVLIELHFNGALYASEIARQLRGQSVARIRNNERPAGSRKNSLTQLNHDIFAAFRTQGYVITHKEPNIQHAGGDCTEFSFLKLSLPAS